MELNTLYVFDVLVPLAGILYPWSHLILILRDRWLVSSFQMRKLKFKVMKWLASAFTPRKPLFPHQTWRLVSLSAISSSPSPCSQSMRTGTVLILFITIPENLTCSSNSFNKYLLTANICQPTKEIINKNEQQSFSSKSWHSGVRGQRISIKLCKICSMLAVENGERCALVRGILPVWYLNHDLGGKGGSHEDRSEGRVFQAEETARV